MTKELAKQLIRAYTEARDNDCIFDHITALHILAAAETLLDEREDET